MGKNIIFGGHQHIISSMHRWRKVICYLMIPLVVAIFVWQKEEKTMKYFGGHQYIISLMHG